jgi:hypothetical protein
MMDHCIRVLCCAFFAVVVAGCELKPNPTGTPPPGPKSSTEPAHPENSIPAATAGEPEKALVEAGRRQLKDKYHPMPVYSKAGCLGIIQLVEDDVCKLADAIIVLEDKEISDSRLKLKNDTVFFNVDKSGPVKVGNFELKQGECIRFSDGKFDKLEIVVSAK